MKPESITADVVQDVLRAIRYGKSLDDSPLLALNALTARLRESGGTDSSERRAWELGRLLDDIVFEQLSRLRGLDENESGDRPTREAELAEVAADFAADSIERQAWSVLRYRYLSPNHQPVGVLTEEFGIPDRTVSRRLSRGHEALAEVLRQREIEAEPAVQPQTNIPQSAARFIGREREIGEVRALLARHRLVTLTGPGGLGKSRLAAEVARSLVREYADGVWFVDLAPHEGDDAATVVRAVGSVLGVEEQPRRALQDLVLAHLRGRQLLLVLDNCEHLAAMCATLAETLLASCPGLQILATSRHLLELQAEAPWFVPPMSLPPEDVPASSLVLRHYDAARLFVDRALLARPGCDVADDAEAVVAICRSLDGLPLAIELAAARVRVLAPRQLLERLDDRMQLLAANSPAVSSRHRTLEAMIAWSHDLLSERERMLFRRLAVFRGGWSVEAAERVCSGDGLEQAEVLSLLDELIAKSLVVADAEAQARRFRFLETVRVYARTRLIDAGEAKQLRVAHRTYYRDFAEAHGEIKTAEAPEEVLAVLECEHANLRHAIDGALAEGEIEAALRLCVALAEFWYLGGHWRDGRAMLDAVLSEADSDADQSLLAAALKGVGVLAAVQGDHKAARDLLANSLALYRRLEDEQKIARLLNNLGIVTSALGELSAARALHEESLALKRERGDKRGTSASLQSLGMIEVRLGDTVAARQHYSESLALQRELGDRVGIASSLNHLGIVAQCEGDYEAARRMHEESLALRRELGQTLAGSSALAFLGEGAHAQGDHDLARSLLEEALEVQRERGASKRMAITLLLLGRVDSAQGQLRAACSHLKESLTISDEIGNLETLTHGLEYVAWIAVSLWGPVCGARLLGAAEAHRAEFVFPLDPNETARRRAALQTVYDELGTAEADAELQHGRDLSLDEAVALVLQQPCDAEP